MFTNSKSSSVIEKNRTTLEKKLAQKNAKIKLKKHKNKVIFFVLPHFKQGILYVDKWRTILGSVV